MLHLLYARFITKRARTTTSQLVAVSVEPFAGLFTQGMVTHETYRPGKDGPVYHGSEAIREFVVDGNDRGCPGGQDPASILKRRSFR